MSNFEYGPKNACIKDIGVQPKNDFRVVGGQRGFFK